MNKRKLGLAFHCHHNVLAECVYDYDERVRFIKEHKPKDERELRLWLFKLIPDDLIPGKDSQAWEACGEAWEAYGEAREAYGEAREAFCEAEAAYDKAWVAFCEAEAAYDKAWEAYLGKYYNELEKLHSRLCPNCPWDRKTIFSKKGGF